VLDLKAQCRGYTYMTELLKLLVLGSFW
jgi:hypothetical protein